MTVRRSATRARGFAMIAVLIVMGGALLVATSLLFVANAQIAGSSVAADRVQAEALARSGVMAVMGRLNEQREAILAGRTPELDDEFVIYEHGSRTGVVRLLPVGPAGERLVPEAGKRDLQVADAEALAATGLVDDDLAGRIVEHRQRTLKRPFQSVGELLGVPGMTAEMLYGSVDDPGRSPGELDGTGDGAARGLADAVTVYGFEPALQANGKLRINLNVPWSDELGERVVDRFGENARDTLKRIMEGGTVFDSETKIYEVLNFFQMDPSDWPDIIDTFTTDDGELHYGRLDINTAPYEALVTLPAIEPEQAADIVRMRDDLDEEERATVAWPAIEGILEAKAYERLGGLITTRSWTYRLRLAAAEVDAGEPGDSSGESFGALGDESTGDSLDGAIVYEVVLDISSPRPRIAYLREVTWLRTATLIAAAVETDDTIDAGGADDETDPPDEPDAEGPGDAISADPETQQQPPDVEAVPPDGAGAAKPAGKRIGRWTVGE